MWQRRDDPSHLTRTVPRLHRRLRHPVEILPYPTLPFRTLPYTTLPTILYPTLPYPNLPCHFRPYPTIPYRILPCPSPPVPSLPYHTLPYPTLPYPTLLYPFSLVLVRAFLRVPSKRNLFVSRTDKKRRKETGEGGGGFSPRLKPKPSHPPPGDQLKRAVLALSVGNTVHERCRSEHAR